ncbi:MAG: hypothetical protein OEQ81_13350 [Flavobacteriaceae bacterium]|nr:hypothetical protein [Flavobacteriaceae bacterium]
MALIKVSLPLLSEKKTWSVLLENSEFIKVESYDEEAGWVILNIVGGMFPSNRIFYEVVFVGDEEGTVEIESVIPYE